MNLATTYFKHKEVHLNGRWIYYKQIAPLLLLYNEFPFRQNKLGLSYDATPVNSIRIGTGKIKILLWSQMHGDESTATKSIFDVLKYIKASYDSDKAVQNLLKKCTLIFVPMLNPDGALAYTRETAQGIDLNRDALALETNEAKILNQIITTEKPNYAFNLHDQTSFYNVAGTNKVATLSFLAPAEEETRQITSSRIKAMSVIASMFAALQEYLPNQIGRYNDAYCDNCFGDNIQKLGFPTILIESGHYPNDEGREKTREFHFIALLSALFAIATNNLHTHKPYFNIPLNEKKFYDLRIDNVIYNEKNTSIAIRYIYKIEKNQLVKVIDPEETIVGKSLENKLFHKIIDAKNSDFIDLKL